MQQPLLLNMRQSTLREASIDLACGDTDRGFVVAVYRMEMGRRMVAVIHGDHDPKKRLSSGMSRVYRRLPFLPNAAAVPRAKALRLCESEPAAC